MLYAWSANVGLIIAQKKSENINSHGNLGRYNQRKCKKSM